MTFAGFADRCRQTSTTTGTGALTLSAAETGWRALSAGYAQDADIPIAIVGKNNDGTLTGEWEVGRAHLDGDGALVRDEVFVSSNANAAVDFDSDMLEVFVTASAAALAERIVAVVAAHVTAEHPQPAGVEAIGSDTFSADFATAVAKTRAMAGAVTIDGTGYAPGRAVSIRLHNGTAGALAVSVVALWEFAGDPPTTLAAGGTGILSASSFGSVEGEVAAAWAVLS